MQNLKRLFFILLINGLFSIFAYASTPPSGFVVLQTDFGLKDGAVNAIKGVIYNVDKSLIISDLTHEIQPYHIWDASYWLAQVANYWPKGTVFVSVIDPGVGTQRRSVVAETNNGYYFVTPDNGTLTAVAHDFGIKAIRLIDENKNRLAGSYQSHTFHGRDVYGYTAARLASGKILFSDVGPEYHGQIVKLSIPSAYIKENKLYGLIIVLDPEYGNLWTNINTQLIKKFALKKNTSYKVTIFADHVKKYEGTITFAKTFGEVEKGANLLYVNSLMNLAIGVNQGNFAEKYQVTSGPAWHIVIEPLTK